MPSSIPVLYHLTFSNARVGCVMETIIIKLLTTEEATGLLKERWSGKTPEPSQVESYEGTVVYIADSTPKSEIKRSVTELLMEKLDKVANTKPTGFAVAPAANVDDKLTGERP
jgi:hypothetical protein